MSGVARRVVRVLGRPLRRRDTFQVADVVVVLGAPLARTGALSAVVEERVVAGVALWRAGAAPLLCVTGGGRPRAEADAMAERVLSLGVPASALRVERTARSTVENARNVAALLAPEGVRTAWLVTQPFHTRRACRCFAAVGLAPLAWHIDGSLEFESARRGLRWAAREYAAWARALLSPPGPRV